MRSLVCPSPITISASVELLGAIMSGAQHMHIIDAVFEPFDQQTLVDAFVADEQSDGDFREGT